VDCQKPDISIIGAGVVGTALGVLAARAGYKIVAIGSRRETSARKAAGLIGQGRVGSPAEAARAGSLVLLTVNDDVIAPLAQELAAQEAVRPGALVVHCSGALASDVLAPLANHCGALTASMHPLQTFPTVQAALETLPGCYFFCEGHAPAVSAAMQLAADIGGVPVEIEADRKTLYHAAACMACNYLATLQEAAIAAAALAGIGTLPARKALSPLVAATVHNVMNLGPGPALTGPIARGDVQTVQRHLAALDATDTDLADIYRQLGRRTVQLARKAGKIDRRIEEEMIKVLGQ
jgi:predicted short-subunit dehydrogenase-like oxidoreductase (DUF2520 family)